MLKVEQGGLRERIALSIDPGSAHDPSNCGADIVARFNGACRIADRVIDDHVLPLREALQAIVVLAGGPTANLAQAVHDIALNALHPDTTGGE